MTFSNKTTNKTRDMVLIALFATVMVICSWISIPTGIPFTMQTFAVFCTVGTLGGKRGTITICIYLLLGIIGIPAFAGGTAGIGILLSNVGGYMIGWIFSALIMWGMEAKFGKKTKILALSMILGLLVCYIFGTVWYMVVYTKGIGKIDLWTAISWCVIPFIIPDMIKIFMALIIRKRLKNIV